MNSKSYTPPAGPPHRDQELPAVYATDVRFVWAGPGTAKLVFTERAIYAEEEHPEGKSYEAMRAAIAISLEGVKGLYVLLGNMIELYEKALADQKTLNSVPTPVTNSQLN